jgi:hypothetical protein
MTWFAISVLVLDGVGLVVAGVMMHHRGLLIGGMICLLVAVGVFLMWQRQQRLMAEVAAARAELASEARSLRTLVRSDTDTP